MVSFLLNGSSNSYSAHYTTCTRGNVYNLPGRLQLFQMGRRCKLRATGNHSSHSDYYKYVQFNYIQGTLTLTDMECT